MEDLTIVNAKEVITLSGHKKPVVGKKIENLNILKNVSISVKNGKISNIGKPLKAKKTIDAKGKIVIPGFVDSHTHLVFGGNRAKEFEQRLNGKTYKEIAAAGGGIFNTVGMTRNASEKDLFETGMKRLDYALNWGTTTIEIKSGYGLNYKEEMKILRVIKKLSRQHPVEIVSTFLGAHEIPRDKDRNKYIDELIKMMPEVKKYAYFCDVFCEKGVFTKEESKKILMAAKKTGFGLKIHADELSSSGGSELAGELDAVSADHIVYPSDKGLELMKKKGIIATLLPGACLYLEHRAPAKKFIDMEIPIALGSDFNPGSSPILAMPIIISLSCILLKLTPAQALVAGTINSAYALGIGDKTGSIEVGKTADMLVLNVDSWQEIPYWLGFNPVERVVKEGKEV
ncbi:MAG: imidazolonepropionase [bacterium]|nr:imidazolonepropionase [bacterium]